MQTPRIVDHNRCRWRRDFYQSYMKPSTQLNIRNVTGIKTDHRRMKRNRFSAVYYVDFRWNALLGNASNKRGIIKLTVMYIGLHIPGRDWLLIGFICCGWRWRSDLFIAIKRHCVIGTLLERWRGTFFDGWFLSTFL